MTRDRLALVEAVRRNRNDVLKAFLDAGADPNDNGGRAGGELLHVMVGSGHFEVAKVLVERGANVKRKDDQGRTPIEESKQRRLVDMAKMMKRQTRRQWWRRLLRR